MEDPLGDKIKRLEAFANTKILPEVYFAVRIDGRGFSGFTERMGYEHPYDDGFKQIMGVVAEGLTKEFNAKLAYTQSDEISLIFGKESDLFDRRLEKLVSTTSSYASCRFSQETELNGEIVMFDSRIVEIPREELVVDYLHWRHIDAIRNALNSWCYWTLRKDGKTKRKATSELKGKGKDYKNELLFNHGINFNDVPLWQKRGILLSWEEYLKEGVDPRTGEKKPAIRRRVKIDEELPTGEEFKEYVQALLADNLS